MAHMTVTPRVIDGDWKDLVPTLDRAASDGAQIIRAGNLPGGMVSGAPAFQVAVQLPDGRTVIAETSWRLMRAALRAIDAAWPEFDETWPGE